MKELNIIEASNMPVGTEFKMIRNGVEMPSRVYIDDDSRCLRWVSGIKEELSIFKDNLNAKFIPIQNPVNFMEAVEAGLTGKYIRVDITHLGIDIYKHDEYVLNPSYNIEYFSIKNIFNMLSNTKYTKEIINDGKWYVKQD